MRTLKFIVTSQYIKKNSKCDFSDIVAGSVGYLKAAFEFSEDWDNCIKVASFWLEGEEHAARLDENGECEIPPEALVGELFSVSVTGAKSNYKIKTNKTKVRQEV